MSLNSIIIFLLFMFRCKLLGQTTSSGCTHLLKTHRSSIEEHTNKQIYLVEVSVLIYCIHLLLTCKIKMHN